MFEGSPDTYANTLLLSIKKILDTQPDKLVHLCNSMNNFDKKLQAIDQELKECSEGLSELDEDDY